MDEAGEAHTGNVTRRAEDPFKIPNCFGSKLWTVSNDTAGCAWLRTASGTSHQESLPRYSDQKCLQNPMARPAAAARLGFRPLGRLQAPHIRCQRVQIGNEFALGRRS